MQEIVGMPVGRALGRAAMDPQKHPWVTCLVLQQAFPCRPGELQEDVGRFGLDIDALHRPRCLARCSEIGALRDLDQRSHRYLVQRDLMKCQLLSGNPSLSQPKSAHDRSPHRRPPQDTNPHSCSSHGPGNPCLGLCFRSQLGFGFGRHWDQ